eukprot:TRINITY_DN6460_c0_g4_i7.p2 TRINITY_DN6460_c0_g4~~TRINITY_DN6460_c0_g4_i7.p2  ORF type:complete len:115 (-),score=5.91 TRINITY_DN6460_c0_g4_i7:1080-1424(-)
MDQGSNNATDKIIARAAERSKRLKLTERSNSRDNQRKSSATPLSQFKQSPIVLARDSTEVYESYKLLPQCNRTVVDALRLMTHSAKLVTASTLSVFILLVNDRYFLGWPIPNTA